MKIECTTEEFETLQKTKELVAMESYKATIIEQLHQAREKNWDLESLTQNLRAENRQLDNQVRNIVNNAPTPDPDERVRFLSTGNRNKLDYILAEIGNGNKISAIKAYRELTGLGLKESKDAVELCMKPYR